MAVCVYVYMHVCVLWLHVSIYVCHACIHVRMCAFAYTCVYLCMYVYVHASMSLYLFIRLHCALGAVIGAVLVPTKHIYIPQALVSLAKKQQQTTSSAYRWLEGAAR